ncbi:MAG: hypothetical protein JOY51_05290 [Nevskia sp.]|nr:hypothetical protein [Nevskia sp.]
MKGSGKLRPAAAGALCAAALCAAPGASAQLLGGNLAPNVNVINTPGVSVVNPASAPVPVHEVTAATRTPVQFELIVSPTQTDKCTAFTVPAGTRLEVDHVSAASEGLDAGNTIRAYYMGVSTYRGESTQFFLDFHDQAFDPSQPLFVADHTLLSFAEPGTNFTLCAVLKNAPTNGVFSQLRASFSGYFITLP